MGPMGTLMAMIQAAPTMAGVSVVYGEEMIAAQDQFLPMVVVVPNTGRWMAPGYMTKALDSNDDAIWSCKQSVDLYLWAFSSAVNAQPVDHADAILALRSQVAQALKYQRDPGGLYIYDNEITERWQTMQGALSRYGRALIVTVPIEFAFIDVVPTMTLIIAETLTQSI